MGSAWRWTIWMIYLSKTWYLGGGQSYAGNNFMIVAPDLKETSTSQSDQLLWEVYNQGNTVKVNFPPSGYMDVSKDATSSRPVELGRFLSVGSTQNDKVTKVWSDDSTSSGLLMTVKKGKRRYMVLPTPHLSTNYSPTCPGTIENYASTCVLSLVSAANNAVVNITLENTTSVSGEVYFDGRAYQPGENLQISFSSVQETVQLNASGGLRFGSIQSTGAMGVLSAAIIQLDNGSEVGGASEALVNQLIPMESWGRRFVIVLPGASDAGSLVRLDIAGSEANSSVLIQHDDHVETFFLDESLHATRDLASLNTTMLIYLEAGHAAQVFCYIIAPSSQLFRMIPVPAMELYNREYSVSTSSGETLAGFFVTRREVSHSGFSINGNKYTGQGSNNQWTAKGFDEYSAVSWTTRGNVKVSRFSLDEPSTKYSFSAGGSPFGLFLFDDEHNIRPTNTLLAPVWAEMTILPEPTTEISFTEAFTNDPNKTDGNNHVKLTTPEDRSVTSTPTGMDDNTKTLIVIVSVLVGFPLLIILILAIKALWESKNDNKHTKVGAKAGNGDIIPLTEVSMGSELRADGDGLNGVKLDGDNTKEESTA